MTRLVFKGRVIGAIFGTTVGMLIGLGLGQVFDQPADIVLMGRLLGDSASHPDSRMNNRLLLVETEFTESVYPTSKTIDINGLYAIPGESIRLRGEFRRLTLTTGESILELEVKEVLTPSTPK